MIAALTTHIDLIKKPSTTLFDILSALTMGLVFLGVWEQVQIASLQNCQLTHTTGSSNIRYHTRNSH